MRAPTPVPFAQRLSAFLIPITAALAAVGVELTAAKGGPPDEPVLGCGKAQATVRILAEQLRPRTLSDWLLDEASADTDLLHNKVDIEVFPATSTITGSNTMTIQSKLEGLTEFTFRLRSSFTVTSALINGATPVVVTTVNTETRMATLDRPYAYDEVFTLQIGYTGVPVSGGFGSIEFTRQNGFGPDIVYTLSEPYYSYTWWPCKDGGYAEPGDNADKATLEMMVTAPEAMTTVSNGLLEGVDVLSGNRRRFRWRSDYPLSTYLVCFSSTEYNTWSQTYVYPGGTMPVDFYIYPMDDNASNRASWNKTVDMLEAFRTPFGEYPFIDEKYGIYECDFGGGMEHQTMTAQGTFSESVTAHELAHQWWGDYVTCKYWNDIWLNEGFATYSEAIWEENKPGSPGLPALHAHMANRRPSRVDDSVYVYNEGLGSLYRIFSSTFSYRKGGWVLHQLRHVVGDEKFWDILAAYREQYGLSGATTDDFAALCSAVYGQDLTYFFEQWVYDIGAPSYSWGWQAVNILGQDYVRLYINQTQTTSYPRFTMPIDIAVTTPGDTVTTYVVFNDADTEHFVIPVNGTPSAVSFDPDKWILWEQRNQVSYVPGPPAVVVTSPLPGDEFTGAPGPSSVAITFSTNVNATATDFTIVGDAGGPRAFTYSYDPVTFTATMDFGGSLPADHYTVTGLDSITAVDSGNALDGELSDPADPASLPSGDGLPGGDSVFVFDVGIFYGDFDGDGDVDLFDYAEYLNCYTGPSGGPYGSGCDVFDPDIDTDVDFADWAVVQSLFTGSL